VRSLVGGVRIGLVTSVTLIAAVYDAETGRPVLAPTGLHFVTTGTYLTRYQAWGPATSAVPVVLVHGAFESVDYWAPVARLLARSTHVEAYDLEGYGYTQRVGHYTARVLAAQLFDFLRVRHLRHAVLVGHSLGAGVIAQFVLEHPRVARGIVFVDGDGLSEQFPATGLLRWVPNLYVAALYRFAVRDQSLVSLIFRSACGPQCPPVTNQVLTMIERPFEAAGAQQALLAYASQPIVGVSISQLREVGRVGIPPRVIFGSDDTEYSSSTPRVTAERLGAPAPSIIDGAGHLSIWSSPDRVARAIGTFVAILAKIPP
jgi:pimeloyl-ACP methyl ester carboxylesterase